MRRIFQLVAAILLSCLPVWGQTGLPSVGIVFGPTNPELGQSATFSVTVNSTDASTVTLQWKKADVDIPGATGSTYTIPVVAASDSGRYSITATNAVGSRTMNFTITVRPAAAPYGGSITANRYVSIISLQEGEAVIFDVSVLGSYPRTFQWLKDGAAIPGATDATYAKTDISISDAGVYSARVTNPYGSTVSPSYPLTINAATPPRIYTYSGDTTITQGESFFLSVGLASGTQPVNYQWRRDGQPIAGATKAEFVVQAAALSDAGKYSAVVSNRGGSDTSREFTVTIRPATPISFFNELKATAVFEGQRVVLGAGASGSMPITYQWFKNGSAIPGATASTYTIAQATPTDAGNYSVRVTNAAGSVTSTPAELTIKPAVLPQITTEPGDVESVEGRSVVFAVAASGSPELAYQWYRNGVKLTGATSATHSASVTRDESAEYHATVSNVAGVATSRAARIKVVAAAAPSVARYAANYDLSLATPLVFNVNGTGGSFTSCQWYRNGQMIPGGTVANYAVTSASAVDTGDYMVVLTNATGSTTSQVSRVSIVPPATRPLAAWFAAQRGGNIAYFAFVNPARIERFDLTAGAWLPALTLTRTPSAFTVSDSDLFIAAGPRVYRYSLSGTNETALGGSLPANITGLVLSQGYLVAYMPGYSADQLASIRLSDGTTVTTESFVYRWGPNMVAAPISGKLFARYTPAIVSSAVFGSDGRFNGFSQSDEAVGAGASWPRRVFLSPNESFVVATNGVVYRASDLKEVTNLGGRLEDLAFTTGNDAIALRRGKLVRFSSDWRETAQADDPMQGAERIFVHGEAIYLFGHAAAGVPTPWAKVTLAQLTPPTPTPPLDASTLAFTPDDTMLDRDGNLLLFSRLHRQVFRWSPARRTYLAPIPLQGWPQAVAYSAAHHRLYLAYNNHRLLQVKLDEGSTAEEPFATLADEYHAIFAAGQHIVVVSTAETWYVYGYHTFNKEGTYTGRRYERFSLEPAWNPGKRRIYAFNSNRFYPVDLANDGTLSEPQAGTNNSGSVMVPPIRVTPDSSSLLLGNGKFYDANTFAVNASLSNGLDDAVWQANRLITGRTLGIGAELQRWGGNNYTLDRSRILEGRLFRLHVLSDTRLLAVTVVGNTVSLTILDAELNPLSTDFSGPPNRMANLAARALVGRGDQILIPGFVVAGSQPKKVLVRAAGPALTAFGVGGALADPRLTIVNSAGATIASNDDWGSAENLAELRDVTGRVGAFALNAGSKDAAALVSLPPGAYSVQTSGTNDTTGVAMVEVYDAQEAGNQSKLVNIAARAQVGTGGDILIPGIVVQGTTSKTLLIRAIGPGLGVFGVSGVLANPRLKVFRGQELVQENDDWDRVNDLTTSNIVGAGRKVGAFNLTAGSRDAALVVTLPPGAYTAQVSGADGGTGVALVEVYEVSN